MIVEKPVECKMIIENACLLDIHAAARHGHNYDPDNVEKAVKAFNERHVHDTGVGEFCPDFTGSRQSHSVDLLNTSHYVKDLYFDNEDGSVYGTVIMLNTPCGEFAKTILEKQFNGEDFQMGFSKRSMCNVLNHAGENNGVSGLEIIEFIAFDLVKNPYTNIGLKAKILKG